MSGEELSPLRPCHGLSVTARNWRRPGRWGDSCLPASTIIQLPFVADLSPALEFSCWVYKRGCVHSWKAKGRSKASNIPTFQSYLNKHLCSHLYLSAFVHLSFISCHSRSPFCAKQSEPTELIQSVENTVCEKKLDPGFLQSGMDWCGTRLLLSRGKGSVNNRRGRKLVFSLSTANMTRRNGFKLQQGAFLKIVTETSNCKDNYVLVDTAWETENLQWWESVGWAVSWSFQSHRNCFQTWVEVQ